MGPGYLKGTEGRHIDGRVILAIAVMPNVGVDLSRLDIDECCFVPSLPTQNGPTDRLRLRFLPVATYESACRSSGLMTTQPSSALDQDVRGIGQRGSSDSTSP